MALVMQFDGCRQVVRDASLCGSTTMLEVLHGGDSRRHSESSAHCNAHHLGQKAGSVRGVWFQVLGALCVGWTIILILNVRSAPRDPYPAILCIAILCSHVLSDSKRTAEKVDIQTNMMVEFLG